MKRTVLQLVDTFHQGGSERQAVQLIRMLHESGRYDVHVACLERSGSLLAEVERLNLGELPEFRLTSFYDLNAVKQLRRFSRLLNDQQIELLQTWDFYSNVFGMAAGALARVPVRIAARRETDGLRTEAQKVVERRAFDLASAVVANSDAVRNQLVRDGVKARKVVTIYNGMDFERIATDSEFERADVLRRLGLPDGRRFVTIVANMRHAMKDQATFLRGAKKVKAEVPDAAFVLAGEGELLDELRVLASKLGLAESAFFLGHCKDVAALLNISDVCVLSSKGVEGFSNSILEYMAAARPVVVTDVGGAGEAVVETETGFIVPPGDHAEMATRIVELLNDREKARTMGEEGQRVVQHEFSLAAQLEGFEKLYERLFNERLRGAGRVVSETGNESVPAVNRQN